MLQMMFEYLRMYGKQHRRKPQPLQCLARVINGNRYMYMEEL